MAQVSTCSQFSPSDDRLLIAGKITQILPGILGDGGYMVEGNPRGNLGCK